MVKSALVRDKEADGRTKKVTFWDAIKGPGNVPSTSVALFKVIN